MADSKKIYEVRISGTVDEIVYVEAETREYAENIAEDHFWGNELTYLHIQADAEEVSENGSENAVITKDTRYDPPSN